MLPSHAVGHYKLGRVSFIVIRERGIDLALSISLLEKESQAADKIRAIAVTNTMEGDRQPHADNLLSLAFQSFPVRACSEVHEFAYFFAHWTRIPLMVVIEQLRIIR